MTASFWSQMSHLIVSFHNHLSLNLLIDSPFGGFHKTLPFPSNKSSFGNWTILQENVFIIQNTLRRQEHSMATGRWEGILYMCFGERAGGGFRSLYEGKWGFTQWNQKPKGFEHDFSVQGPQGWVQLPLLFLNGGSVQFSSLMSDCDPMDCSTPGFLVHHQLPKLAQTHAHQVSDAIQPSHPLSSPSPAFNLSQHQGLFQWVNCLHQVA